MVIVIVALILAIALVIGILVAWMAWKRKREGKPVEASYHTFFTMGVIWVPFSIVLMVIYFILQIPFFIGFPLFVLGLIYLIIGLKNRDKWKKT